MAIYVDSVNGNDASSGADWDNAVKTISYGISIVPNAPEVIMVANGIYYENSLDISAGWSYGQLVIVGIGDVVISASGMPNIFNISAYPETGSKSLSLVNLKMTNFSSECFYIHDVADSSCILRVMDCSIYQQGEKFQATKVSNSDGTSTSVAPIEINGSTIFGMSLNDNWQTKYNGCVIHNCLVPGNISAESDYNASEDSTVRGAHGIDSLSYPPPFRNDGTIVTDLMYDSSHANFSRYMTSNIRHKKIGHGFCATPWKAEDFSGDIGFSQFNITERSDLSIYGDYWTNDESFYDTYDPINVEIVYPNISVEVVADVSDEIRFQESEGGSGEIVIESDSNDCLDISEWKESLAADVTIEENVNDWLDIAEFIDDAWVEVSVQASPGIYDLELLCYHLQDLLYASSAVNSYSVVFYAGTTIYVSDNNDNIFKILIATGAHSSQTIGGALGFSGDQEGLSSYEGSPAMGKYAETSMSVAAGSYTPAELCQALNDALMNYAEQSYTVSLSDNKITIADDNLNIFSLLFSSGSNSSYTIANSIGFDGGMDYTDEYTYTGDALPGGAVIYSAKITDGEYTSYAALITAIGTALNNAGGSNTYSASFHTGTRKITISSSGSFFSILWTDSLCPAASLLGFDVDNYTGATQYTGQSEISMNVASGNAWIDINRDDGDRYATIAGGVYDDGNTLIDAILYALNALSFGTYEGSYMGVDRKIRISEYTHAYNILWGTGVHSANSAAEVLGFDASDDTGNTTYSSDNRLPGINPPGTGEIKALDGYLYLDQRGIETVLHGRATSPVIDFRYPISLRLINTGKTFDGKTENIVIEVRADNTIFPSWDPSARQLDWTVISENSLLSDTTKYRYWQARITFNLE